MNFCFSFFVLLHILLTLLSGIKADIRFLLWLWLCCCTSLHCIQTVNLNENKGAEIQHFHPHQWRNVDSVLLRFMDRHNGRQHNQRQQDNHDGHQKKHVRRSTNTPHLNDKDHDHADKPEQDGRRHERHRHRVHGIQNRDGHVDHQHNQKDALDQDRNQTSPIDAVHDARSSITITKFILYLYKYNCHFYSNILYRDFINKYFRRCPNPTQI